MDTHTSDGEELVSDHLPLVDHLVREVAARAAAGVDRDDLRLVGRLALARAVQAWEPESHGSFTQVATVWIRAAIADELLAIEWMADRSRRALAGEVRLARAIAALPDRLRVVATAYFLEHRPTTEVAAELGATQVQVARLRAQALVLLRGVLAEADPVPSVAELHPARRCSRKVRIPA